MRFDNSVLITGIKDACRHYQDVKTQTTLDINSQTVGSNSTNRLILLLTSFFQLCLLAKVKPFLCRQDLEKAIHVFISSRLDYCNALHVGLSQSSISRLQLVQNAASRFLTSTSRREHIASVLSSLHWLPVRFRIVFSRICFKCH